MWKINILGGLKQDLVFRRVFSIAFHLVGVLGSFWAATLLRFDFQWAPQARDAFLTYWIWITVGFFGSILAFRLYRGLWRFFTLRDCFTTGVAVVCGVVCSGILIYFTNGNTFFGFPRSTLITTGLILLAWEIGSRGAIRLAREHRVGRGSAGGVLLLGNPDDADALLRNLVRYPQRIGKVVALISHTDRHRKQQLRGVPIFGPSDKVSDVVLKKKIETVLFLPPLNSPSHIRETMDQIGGAGLKCDYRFIPSIEDLASGRLGVDQMRKVSIEDLLHRPPHKIDLVSVRSSICGKKILVTGAGGSIGSEICRQVLKLRPTHLVLFDASEYLLFEIERELRLVLGKSDLQADGEPPEIVAITGDVRRQDQVRKAIEASGGVDVLYHAAAYKHVDLMERNSVACFQNNVIGTATVAATAEECGVDEFVLVSTDKAVRPTSLMGASKRLAERVIIERPIRNTRFKAVRFGNVLGSSGSVIPIFREQIRTGGPVTVTSDKVTRYFMTIPEAVELVIAAGAVAEDRRICVLEMGDPVKIDTLARRMIELSGFIPDVDVKIVYTGLKPGEKEFEELLTDDEGVVRTDHDRIWVVEKDSQMGAEPLDLGELFEIIDEGDPDALREYAHRNVRGSLLV